MMNPGILIQKYHISEALFGFTSTSAIIGTFIAGIFIFKNKKNKITRIYVLFYYCKQWFDDCNRRVIHNFLSNEIFIFLFVFISSIFNWFFYYLRKCTFEFLPANSYSVKISRPFFLLYWHLVPICWFHWESFTLVFLQL